MCIDRLNNFKHNFLMSYKIPIWKKNSKKYFPWTEIHLSHFLVALNLNLLKHAAKVQGLIKHKLYST